jgi:hypothetical protein
MHVHVGEGGEKNLKSDNCTSFHIGLRLLVITLVFFYAKTSSVEKENPFSFCDGYQNLQHLLLENLMYLWLRPPKNGKLHPCENFHTVNTCHLHIGQWVSKFFIPKFKSCTMRSLFHVGRANKQTIFLHKWTSENWKTIVPHV